MSIALMTGTILVLATWLACLVGAVATGLLPSLIVTRGRWTQASARIALWWGAAILTILVVGLSVVVPMRSAAAAVLALAVVVVLGIVGVVRVRRAANSGSSPATRGGAWLWVLMAALLLAVVYLAAAALGPVTNYDTGLYHLGAIAYAGDFRAVPGLANLYFPFGYANAEFPLAALLGNGPWDGIGYRLLNGLLFAMVAVDLGLRARRGPLTAGFFVLAVSLTAALVPMVALSDYWVTSPTSDSAVLAVTIAAVAYLVDAVSSARDRGANASVAVALSAVSVMLRPTMSVFAVTVVAVVLVVGERARRRSAERLAWPVIGITSATALLAAVVVSARDFVLSGWIQFPLSLHAFDVPWLAPDPTDVRTATLGAARDPLDLWNAAHGWGWVGVWLGRLPQQWEALEFAALAIAAIVLLVLAVRTGAGIRVRALLLAMAPSAAAAAFWWLLTPPSFRFIWGPLFTLAAIPAGWALWRLADGRSVDARARMRWRWVTVLGMAVPVVAVTLFSAAFRFDAGSVTVDRTWHLGVAIPYQVAAVTPAEVSEAPLPSGLTVLVPVASDQCWLNYPLCSPMAPSTLAPRGEGLQQGFTH